MIKQIGSKKDIDEAKTDMDSLSTIPGFVFACVEPDGNDFRCVSYWDVDGKALKGQRNIPHFSL